MSTNSAHLAVQREGRILLAIEAIQKGQIQSIQAAAKAYNVPRQTLSYRLRGRASRVDSTPNSRKLTTTEESTLRNWIISADQRGLPPRIEIVRDMAQILLAGRVKEGAYIGKQWVKRFIKRQEDLKSKYTRRYDYQRAKCEDPKIIKVWFALVQNTIAKYGILEQDIYNFDETGFSMGMTSTCKVSLYPDLLN